MRGLSGLNDGLSGRNGVNGLNGLSGAHGMNGVNGVRCGSRPQLPQVSENAHIWCFYAENGTQRCPR
eukprot:9145100-Lingulodinium_polyedra.AAC.1